MTVGAMYVTRIYKPNHDRPANFMRVGLGRYAEEATYCLIQ